MTAVTMRHPTLPPTQTITVTQRSVPHHQAAGWEVVVDVPATKPQAVHHQPADGGDSSEPVAPKRRRAHKEED
jgi:hypothetical protein